MKKVFLVVFGTMFFIVFLLFMLEFTSYSRNSRSDGPKVISTLTEISSTVGKISANQGGTVSHEGLTVQLPANSLISDSEVKVALVTIDNNKSQGKCYKISTNSPDEVLELKEPATVKISGTATGKSAMVFWDGTEWLPVDSSYDSNKKEVTLKLNCIYKDISQWFHSGGELGIIDGAIVLAWFDWVDEQAILNLMSKNSHFEIKYWGYENRFYAEKIANFLEDGYDFYISDPGEPFRFVEPVKFIINEPNNVSDHVVVYIKTFSSSLLNDLGITGSGLATPLGYIRIPKDLEANDMQVVCCHELFHLIQFNYSNRMKDFNDHNKINQNWPDIWFFENTADTMGLYAFNNINRESFYDYEGGYRHWAPDDGSNFFTYSLESDRDLHEYENRLFWNYMIKIYGFEIFKTFISDNSPNYVRNLQGINDKCLSESKIKKPLDKVYFEAFEDYYIYGKFFNSDNFVNLKDRPPGQPYFKDKAINPFNNSYFWPYSITVNLEHLSGNYFVFNSGSNKGNLYLTVKYKSPSVKTRIFYFMDQSTVLKPGEFTASDINHTITNFGSYITDVCVLLENTSLTDDTQVNLTAYADSGTGSVPAPAGPPPDMTEIPGGTFKMGSDKPLPVLIKFFVDIFCIIESNTAFSLKPVHEVIVSPFYMGKHEVTNEEYCRFLNSEGNQAEGKITLKILHFMEQLDKDIKKLNEKEKYVEHESELDKPVPWIFIANDPNYPSFAITGGPDRGTFSVRTGYEKYPAAGVTWYGAVAYCNWRSKQEGLPPCYGDKDNRGDDPSLWRAKNGYRLATEAEWEYACRAGSTGDYYWGNEINGDYFWYSENSGGILHPVGEKLPNNFDLYDMSGNAEEWCNDWYGVYPEDSQTDPAGPSCGTLRVARSGSAGSPDFICQSSMRAMAPPVLYLSGLGFRIVRNK
ncbi:MAG: formylglycine-generating enzyme family protein [Candidatus Eremiobacterota bacterium]